HLLTHTAGLPQMLRASRAYKPILGEAVPFGSRVPTLAEFYRGRLRLVAEPGTVLTYSNHGFGTLGQVVQDVSGEPLHRYFRENLFEPLGMADTDLVRSERIASRLATGYRLGRGGPQPATDWDTVPLGAGAIYSTTRDMARYVAALLDGGRGEYGSILATETLASMYAPHYQPDPRLPGVGLAFFRHVAGGHLLIAHDGLGPGFGSAMCLAPDDGIGVVGFTNGAVNAKAWLESEVGRLLRALLGVRDDVIRTDVPHHPELWPDLCGWYALRGSLRDVQRWLLAGADVFVRRDQLMLRAVSPLPAANQCLLLHPDHQDPYVFRIDLSALGLGTGRVVFSREPGPAATSLHLDIASLFPLSFDRRSTARNPRRWAAGVLGAVAVTTAATAARRHRPRKG
ncbi:MAG: serine hydrolase, partial [Micromonosporaceae bacterium]